MLWPHILQSECLTMRFVPRLLLLLPLAVIGLSPAAAQMSASDVVMRLEALESQIRQMTGQIEQLQFRNQQLEQQLKRTTEDTEFRFQELSGGKGASPRAATAPQRPPVAQAPQPQAQAPQAPLPQAPAPAGRRGDAFDPNANPGAPGAPLDLANVGSDPRRGGAAVAPPSESPRDYFDMGYGHFQRRDYASAEQTFKDFLARYPSDKMAPEANYWLGESLFQRQRYQDAAESYLVVTTKFGQNSRAPDALLRLGQSLAAMGQKEMACASFAEIGRKYPNSSAAVKQGAEREQKRVRC